MKRIPLFIPASVATVALTMIALCATLFLAPRSAPAAAKSAVRAPLLTADFLPRDVAALKSHASQRVTARPATPAAPTSYTVRAGDTLTHIAASEYGSAAEWPALWWINRGQLKNPNSLLVGRVLRLSRWHPAAGWILTAAVRAVKASTPHHWYHYQSAVTVTAAPVAHPAPAAPAPVANVATSGMSAFESCVIAHESGGNPAIVNASSGAGGLFQFLPSTWASLGYAGSYPGGAQTAPVAVQEAAFAKLYAEAGTSPWAPYDGC